MVTVGFGQVLVLPQTDALAVVTGRPVRRRRDRDQRVAGQAAPDVVPARLGREPQQFRGREQRLGQHVDAGQLPGRIAASFLLMVVRPELRRGPQGERQAAVTLLQHRLIDSHRARHEGPRPVPQEHVIERLAVVEPVELREPAGHRLIQCRMGSQAALALAAVVIDRMGQQQAVVHPCHPHGVLTHHALARGGVEHVEQGQHEPGVARAEGQGVDLLDVDVDGVIALPGRHLVLLVPGPLERRGLAGMGVGRTGELVLGVVVETLEEIVRQAKLRHAVPVTPPPNRSLIARHGGSGGLESVPELLRLRSASVGVRREQGTDQSAAVDAHGGGIETGVRGSRWNQPRGRVRKSNGEVRNRVR